MTEQNGRVQLDQDEYRVVLILVLNTLGGIYAPIPYKTTSYTYFNQYLSRE